jgi:hypothetical protein
VVGPRRAHRSTLTVDTGADAGTCRRARRWRASGPRAPVPKSLRPARGGRFTRTEAAGGGVQHVPPKRPARLKTLHVYWPAGEGGRAGRRRNRYARMRASVQRARRRAAGLGARDGCAGSR